MIEDDANLEQFNKEVISESTDDEDSKNDISKYLKRSNDC